MVNPELFQALVEQAKDYAVFLLGPDGRILSWNAGARIIKGYEADEIVGQHFSVFYTQEAIARGWPSHELRVATVEGRFEDEGWRIRKDGSRFWASVIITALRDPNGKLMGFSKITRDLTDRKLQDEALRQSEERFRLLIDGVTDYAIYMLDPDGIVTSWNQGAERIKGYPRTEIIGAHFSRFYLKEDIETGKPWEELAIAKREGRIQAEGWRVRKNGERFWARIVVSALHGADGHMRGFAKVTQDLSLQRHAYELERGAKNVHEFIATLSHELRNPLAPIRTGLQVMGRLPPGDPRHEDLRKTLERQSEQLGRIVDDMLDVSRVAQGIFSIEKKPMDLAEAIQQAVETSMALIEGKKHRLDLDVSKEALIVEGDRLRLTQLFTNLLNNAARYTPAGGRLSVSAETQDTAAVVKIRDNGEGIDPTLIEKIFDMFVQGQSSKQQVGGMGVGLALSRRIAESHDGSLSARSAGPGQGSEFIFRMPLSAGARISVTPAPRLEQPIALRRILIVDDNADAANTLGTLLESLGHKTSVVYDGNSALAKAAEFRPDIVLLDLGMPGMNGYEVARRLMELKRQRPFRIIAVSGWGQEADRAKTRESGFDAHIIKPVDLEILQKAINERTGSTLH
jgi:PAS domain S-box-containing protein